MIESDTSGFSQNDNRTRVGLSPSVAPATGSEDRRPACAQASRGLSAPSNITSVTMVKQTRGTSGVPPGPEQPEANRCGESKDGNANPTESDILRGRSRFDGPLRPRNLSANPLSKLSHRRILCWELDVRDIAHALESAVRAGRLGINRLVP